VFLGRTEGLPRRWQVCVPMKVLDLVKGDRMGFALAGCWRPCGAYHSAPYSPRPLLGTFELSPSTRIPAKGLSQIFAAPTAIRNVPSSASGAHPPLLRNAGSIRAGTRCGDGETVTGCQQGEEGSGSLKEVRRCQLGSKQVKQGQEGPRGLHKAQAGSGRLKRAH